MLVRHAYESLLVAPRRLQSALQSFLRSQLSSPDPFKELKCLLVRAPHLAPCVTLPLLAPRPPW